MKATSLLFVHLPVYTVSAPSALIFSSFIFVGVEPFEQWNLQSFFIHFFFSLHFVALRFPIHFSASFSRSNTNPDTNLFFLHFTSSWTMAVKAEKPIQNKGVQCICKMFMNSHWIYFQKKKRKKNKAQRNFFSIQTHRHKHEMHDGWMNGLDFYVRLYMNRIEMAHKTKLTSRWQFQRNFCAHIHTYILAIFSQYATSDVRAIWVSAFFFLYPIFFVVCTWFFAVSHSFVCFQVEYKFNYLYTYICIEWGAHTQMLLCQTITEDGNFLAFKRNQKTIKKKSSSTNSSERETGNAKKRRNNNWKNRNKKIDSSLWCVKMNARIIVFDFVQISVTFFSLSRQSRTCFDDKLACFFRIHMIFQLNKCVKWTNLFANVMACICWWAAC